MCPGRHTMCSRRALCNRWRASGSAMRYCWECLPNVRFATCRYRISGGRRYLRWCGRSRLPRLHCAGYLWRRYEYLRWRNTSSRNSRSGVTASDSGTPCTRPLCGPRHLAWAVFFLSGREVCHAHRASEFQPGSFVSDRLGNCEDRPGPRVSSRCQFHSRRHGGTRAIAPIPYHTNTCHL